MNHFGHNNPDFFRALLAVASRSRIRVDLATNLSLCAGMVISFCLLLLPVAQTTAAPGLALAADGQALESIVIATNASRATASTARELAEHLHRITGARFFIQPGDATRGIILGTLAEFPDPELREPLALRDHADGREAFAIRTDARRVRLLGATDIGVSHAAFRLLEELGCRWFFPAPEWEVLPTIPRLSVSLDLTDRPAILSRRIWWGYGFFDPREKRCQSDYEAWSRRNRMAMSRKIWCGHAWQTIIADNQAVFTEHPEYLALVKGRRQGPQFCVSTAAVRRLATDWALNQLRRKPDLDMVSLETADGDGHCECDACRKLGGISDRVFGLANEVARAVHKEFPGKMVGLYAYNDHCEPPSFQLEPNVYVQSTAGFIRGRYTFEELMNLWPKVCRNLGFYEYFSVWLWDFDRLPGGNGGNLKHIRERIPAYARLGATSIDCESGNNWGLHGRGYYLANRLMWNPRADVDALLADFYTKAFGPAAPALRRYYERLDPGNQPLLNQHLIALALRDLEEASRLAHDRPDVLARLAHLKQFQHYTRLRWEFDRATDKSRKQELALATLTHVYRHRYSYMNHWEAMRQSWVADAVKQFGVADWPKTTPWKSDAPPNPDQTERDFRADLEFFTPEPVTETAFSPDLVPTALTAGKPAASAQKYQRGGRYALFSRQGEALEVTVTTGIIAWYRDRAEATYKLTDPAGNTLGSGRLPQDGQDHPLKLSVPKAGLYWFEFNDHAAGWGIKAPPGQPLTLALNRATPAIHMGHMQRMYFFVPQGTRQLAYHWSGGPHELCGPDGKLLQKIASQGRSIIVDVPPGTDGKPWSLTKLALGHLWFYNAPNYLAASPEALLLPREHVPADALPRPLSVPTKTNP